jgi:hypothetical protein
MRHIALKASILNLVGGVPVRFESHSVGVSQSRSQRHVKFELLILMAMFAAALCSAPTSSAQASDVYITPDGSGQGVCTNNPHNPAWFNSGANWGTGGAQIGPGTTVHLCGTFNGSAGSTLLTFQGNGANGNPITVLFESGAQLNAPYWGAGNGAINVSGRSFITIDGGTNGTIQNTANGDQLANRQISTLINGYSCSNCTIQNLTLANDYVTVKGILNVLGGPMTQMNAVTFSGSNWTIKNNTIHDCGWCLYNVYGNGDSNIQVYNNEIYHWDHAYMFATSGANSASNFSFHDNNIHDNLNFETIGCVYHLDGIHFFGTVGSSMSDIYVYNNWFHGTLSGPCSSGFIFMEGGTGTPSHASNSYWWNNVFDASGSDAPNANGWVGIFSGESGETKFVNNTMVAVNGSDNDVCYNIKAVNNLTFEDNVVSNCGIQVGFGQLTGTSTIDYNVYGTSCQNGNNCFVFNGAFEGNFSTWKNALKAAGINGADAHSVFTLTPNLNTNGTPQSNYVGSQWGVNLASLASGVMASLSDDTTQGDRRTALARPSSASCSSQPSSNCWGIGAYQVSGTASSPPNPPSGLVASVN